MAFSAASYAINRIFGPKPPKVTKGQQSGELFIQNADEGSPVAEIYGSDGTGSGGGGSSSTMITWTNLVNCIVNPEDNSLEKTSGNNECFEDATGVDGGGVDGGAWSMETISGGNWEIAWTLGPEGPAEGPPEGPNAGRTYVGLKDGSFNLNYMTWDYVIHVSTYNNTIDPFPPDTVFVYEPLGPPIGFGFKAAREGEWNEGDTLRIRCMDGVITYWHKDVLMYTSTRAPIYPMRIMAGHACLNRQIIPLSLTREGATGIALGGIKTAGTVIWCTEPKKVVTTEKKGGKGAPKQTVETITYYTNLAILFGRGRLRLKKLWANADLIIDLTAPLGQSTGLMESGMGGGGSYSTTSPPMPSAGGSLAWSSRPTTDANGTLSGSTGAGGAAMRFYEGNYDQLPDALIEADVGAGNAPAYRGFCYLVIENFNISKYGGVPTFLATLENADFTDLDQIADHLCERVGIEPGDRDFSAFDGRNVRGLIVNDTQAPRQTLELAAMPYSAQFYETVDGMLTGKYFGDSPVVTIDPNDLGMVEGDQSSVQGELGNKLEFSLVVDDQLPRQISVTAFDPSKNHETTTQHAYRMQGFAQGVEQLTLPMALTPDETRQTTERILYQRHVERESSALKLPWKYCWVNPTDIVTVQS
ncbi:MAG: phage tail protein, partial [Blastocatellia bacterium]